MAAENGQSAFEPSQVGNPKLGPERTRETEGGFDASALGGRVTASFTYYNARTNGALVPVILPPSLGFGNRQLENIGVLKNHGSETSINIDFIRRAKLDVSAGISYTTVNNEAGDLGGQTITVDANSLSFVKQGLPRRATSASASGIPTRSRIPSSIRASTWVAPSRRRSSVRMPP